MVLFFILLSYLACFVFLMAGILLIIYRKDVQIERRISTQFGTINVKNRQVTEKVQSDNFFGRVLQPIFQYIRKKILSRMSKSSMKELDKRLRDAGRPFRLNAIDFRVAQVSLSLTFFCGSIFVFLYHNF